MKKDKRTEENKENNSTRENMQAEKKSTRAEHPRKENKGTTCPVQ